MSKADFSVSRFLRRTCPYCGQAPFAAGWFRTHPRCPTCGGLFLREEGFYAGAVYSAYFLFAATGALAAGLAMLAGAPWGVAYAIACAAILASAHLILVYSRLAFVYGEHRFFSKWAKDRD
jgi:uncharacterized protein (DUF983 family)